MKKEVFHILEPGKSIPDDWCHFEIPSNITVGIGTVIDSSYCFRQYFSKLEQGMKLGQHVTIKSSTLATEENGFIEIGDYTYIFNASIACSQKVVIGSYVYISSGVNIVDTDFHPILPSNRLVDTIAISTIGDKNQRPVFQSSPVIIEDDVWIGYNATIMKGVRIGKGAIVQPGSVVIKDVGPNEIVEGNPARVVNINQKHELSGAN
jgi:acetyltransferase-like isoleucine patch superfamily enzyme